MKPLIAALGTANPEHLRSQTHAAAFIADIMQLTGRDRKKLERVFANSGIQERYSAVSDYTKSLGDFAFFPNTADFNPFPTTADRMRIYEKEAIELAVRAVQNCIAPLENFSLQNVTHLITVSCTGMYTPGIDIELLHRLGLKTQTQRTAINFMGCYGAFNGLKAADAICRAYPNARVLLVSVELCSLHIQQHPTLDNIISSAIFSDGAAAAIIQNTPESKPALSLDTFYCDITPNSHADMAWHIGNHGFEMALSAYVPAIIESGIAELTTRLLSQEDATLADIDLYAIHPGGKKILEACETALKITQQDNRYSYAVLKKYGNMSSATVLFVLNELLQDATPAWHGKRIASMGFGPGLTLESMLLKIVYA